MARGKSRNIVLTVFNTYFKNYSAIWMFLTTENKENRLRNIKVI